MTIFDAEYAKATNLRGQVETTFPFILKNQPVALINDADTDTLLAMKRFSPSPIINIFRAIADAGTISDYTVFDLSLVKDDMPAVFSFDQISIDGSLLPGIPTRFAKPWVNLTSTTGRRQRSTDPLPISDIPRTCAYFARAALCASYHRAMARKGARWMPADGATFVMESYSMTVGMLLQRRYTLDFNEAVMVKLIFALFYASRIEHLTAGTQYPNILNRVADFTPGTIIDVRDQLEEVFQSMGTTWKDASFSQYCAATAVIGPSRMHKFSSGVLRPMFSAAAADSMIMNLAIDYPPYWAFQMLNYTSGWKNGVVGSLANIGYWKKKIVQFASSLSTIDTVIKFDR